MDRRILHSVIVRALFLLVAAACPAALAQELPSEMTTERAGDPAAPRPDLPRIDTPQKKPEFEVPAQPDDGGRKPGQPAITLDLREVRLVGNRALETGRLREVTKSYEGRRITDVDLQEMRARLIKVYRDAGYATARAELPDQDVSGGIITIELVEGRLAGVEVLGEHHYDPEFLGRRIAYGAGDPLDVDALQDHLRWMLSDPLLKDLDAKLLPGTRPGESRLQAIVEEGDRFAAQMTIANDRSPTIGGERGYLLASARNLMGRGDEFGLMLEGAEGMWDVHGHVSIPLNAAGTQLFLRYADYDAEIVEEPLADFDIETDFRTLEAQVSHPFYRSPNRSMNVEVGFERRASESYLAGVPHSFSSGAEDGKTDISVVRTGVYLLERGPRGALSAQLTVSTGLDVLGATHHDNGRPDSRFVALLVLMQAVRVVGPGQLFGRFDMQQASDALLPLEKFVLGGSNSVRGFRRARLVRDNGWAGSIEYRLPLFRLPVPYLSSGANDGKLSAVAFVDAGRAWNDVNPEGALNKLYSAGPGVRWDIGGGTRAEVYWGGAWRRDVDTVGDDIQDHGVHFLFTARRTF